MHLSFRVMCVLFLACSWSARPQDARNILDVAQEARAATAMVQLDDQATATAFCIHPSGYYLTNDHVFRQTYKQCSLVLGIGTESERKHAATVLRRSAASDLALVRIAQTDGPHLPLGDDSTLVETMDVLVLGFPLGNDLSVTSGAPASVSINSGHITSLRKEGDVLREIQFDAQVNPGNSGGPLLRPDGTVIGVVASGLPGTRINAAIALPLVREFLQKPELLCAFPETLAWEERHMDTAFPAWPIYFTETPPAGLRYELQLHDGVATRTLAGNPAENGMAFTLQAPPIPYDADALPRAHVKYGETEFTGEVTLDGLIADGAQIDKNNLYHYTRTPEPVYRDPAGTPHTLSEPLAGNVTILIAGQEVRLNMADIETFDIVSPPYANELRYEARLMLEDSLLWVKNGVLPWSGFPEALLQSPDRKRPPAELENVPSGEIPTMETYPPVVLPPWETATFAGDQSHVSLPAPYTSVVPAGGGRYVLLPLLSVQKLAIVDLVAGDIRGYVPLEATRPLLAAGANYFFVLDANTNLLTRYSLPDGTEEAKGLVPTKFPMSEMAMGYASNGPLLVRSEENREVRLSFIDVRTLADVIPLEGMEATRANVGLTLSANGQLALLGQVTALTLSGNAVVARANVPARIYGLPGPDARRVFTDRGILTILQSATEPGTSQQLAVVPTTSPHFYLRLPEILSNSEIIPPRVCLTNDNLPVAPLPSLSEMEDPSQPSWLEKSGAWRMHYVEQANVLATFPKGDDRIVLRRFNVESALEAANVDYLYVTSELYTLATPGTTLEYPLHVASRHNDLVFHVDAGTPEMSISGEGVFRWEVPPTQRRSETVIIRIVDGRGQQTYHVFKIPLATPPSAEDQS